MACPKNLLRRQMIGWPASMRPMTHWPGKETSRGQINSMAPPLLTIADAGVNLGDRWLLRGADLSLHAGDRLALVGRNGAGKSSLMKLLAGQGEMDEGSLWVAPGASIAYLPQAPHIPESMSLRAIVTAGVDDAHLDKIAHKADSILMRNGPGSQRMSDGLSGGEARRVSLARALYTQPD